MPINTEGLSEQVAEVRRYGHSKSGGIRRQFVLGVVQTADGLPLYHEVFDGNVAESQTLRATLDKVLERFPIRLVIRGGRSRLDVARQSRRTQKHPNAERTAARDGQIKTLDDRAADWAEKLNAQEGGKRYRGRKLSDAGARARFYHEALDSKLGRIIRVDLKSELFSYTIDRKARRLEELLPGFVELFSVQRFLKDEERGRVALSIND